MSDKTHKFEITNLYLTIKKSNTKQFLKTQRLTKRRGKNWKHHYPILKKIDSNIPIWKDNYTIDNKNESILFPGWEGEKEIKVQPSKSVSIAMKNINNSVIESPVKMRKIPEFKIEVPASESLYNKIKKRKEIIIKKWLNQTQLSEDKIRWLTEQKGSGSTFWSFIKRDFMNKNIKIRDISANVIHEEPHCDTFKRSGERNGVVFLTEKKHTTRMMNNSDLWRAFTPNKKSEAWENRKKDFIDKEKLLLKKKDLLKKAWIGVHENKEYLRYKEFNDNISKIYP